MTIAEEIRRLTEDPGANRLAQYFEALQQRVDECCGLELNKRGKPSAEPNTPAPASTAAAK